MSSAPSPAPPAADISPPPPDATLTPPPDATPPPPDATPPPPDATPPPPDATPPPPDATPPPPDATPPPPDATPPPPDATPPPPDATPPPPDATTPPPPDATTPPPPDATSPPPDATTPPPPPDLTTPPPPDSAAPPPAGTTPATPPAPAITPPAPPGSPTPPPPTGVAQPPPAPGKGTPSLAPPPPYGGQPSPSSPPPGTSTSLVVGVAVGGVVILLVLAVVVVCCFRKKKRRSEPTYYGGPPPPPPVIKDNGGYWQHQSTPNPGEHIVKIPQGPLPPPPFGSHAFQPGSLPPPPIMSSSGGSGYSNSEATLQPTSSGVSVGMSQSTFTYEELVMATDGFSDANLLGQGGFGFVHRGVLPNGKEVAVKQLKSGSGQGEREFQAEVEIISRVHHKHLVSLVGYCISGGKRLLVYEFVPNNTMEFHLHGKGRPTMDWSTRLRIALGSAKGLAYLHEDCHPRIIHRDIKASNILVDYKFEAKVADFGLAKLSEEGNTHISTRVMGTFGYLAPEYASSGKLTDKSDVFSYGVMLLELITGRRPVDSNQSFMDDSLVDWARPLLLRALEEGNYDALVDSKLGKDYNSHEMAGMIACAAACVRHSAKRRPRMSQIVRALEGDVSLEDLNEGIKPGHSRFLSSYGSTDYDSSQYSEDMKKFRKMALATSQEYTSSEYSMPTSEYGLNASGSSSEGPRAREAKKDGHRYDNF